MMDENYYNDERNVDQYTKFTPAHDGSLLVAVLQDHLPAQSTLLEIGIGPGHDFRLLCRRYRATGSDLSKVFLARYRDQDPAADLLRLDARTLDTDRRFDAIYSNKALIHLLPAELDESFARQHAVLNDGGLILHSFWHGEGMQSYDGLRMVFRNESDLAEMLEPGFEILAMEKHAKMADGDSIYVLARKRGAAGSAG